MPLLASLLLRLLHLVYAAWLLAKAWLPQRTALPLTTPRRKSPKHLAVVLVADNAAHEDDLEDVYVQCAENAARLCRESGIPVLTMYDPEGVLMGCVETIRERVRPQKVSEDAESSDSDVQYPLTPPLSDVSESRPLSPELHGLDKNLGVFTIDDREQAKPLNRGGVMRRRKPQARHSDGESGSLTIHVVSRESGKPALASLAQAFARVEAQKRDRKMQTEATHRFHLTVPEVAALTEGPRGFPSPDFMIVHQVSAPAITASPLELFGFPPWQMHLPEIHHSTVYPQKPVSAFLRAFRPESPPLHPLEEHHFRRALDEFAAAEMRLGK